MAVCNENFNFKTEKHGDQNVETVLSDCLPRCLDWQLLLFVTPMLRATDQIRDTVRQMSALALCSKHGLLAHTPKKRGGGPKGENRVGTEEEKMDGTRGERREKKTGAREEEEERKDGRRMRRVCPRKSDVTPRRLDCRTRSTLSCSCRTATSFVTRKWHYKFGCTSPWLTSGRNRTPHIH